MLSSGHLSVNGGLWRTFRTKISVNGGSWRTCQKKVRLFKAQNDKTERNDRRNSASVPNRRWVTFWNLVLKNYSIGTSPVSKFWPELGNWGLGFCRVVQKVTSRPISLTKLPISGPGLLKQFFLHFFLKLIWLGIGFSNTNSEISCKE